MTGRLPSAIFHPQFAIWTAILGSVCGLAVYSERYARDEGEIDGLLKQRYLADMQEQVTRTPKITQTLKGENMKLDDTMNKLVWGGKAASPGGGSPNLIPSRGSSNRPDDEEPTESEVDTTAKEEKDADSEEDESQMTKSERKQKRKERKRRRAEEKKRKEMERKQQEEQERRQLMVMSVVGGAVVGAVAVGASMLIGGTKK
eukprot:Nitzschia sp. Nitz4//scaffold1_size375055//113848//114453//NITZ4_000245-RA/size375055-processed-gene-0.336-mRNA-1//1//CDS//3329540952//33//frame0